MERTPDKDREAARRPLPLAVLVLASACAAPARAPEAAAVYVLVLGTAQDAGLPQIGCDAELCRGARRDPTRRRLASSLLLVDARSGQRWLFDATPDLREQVELAAGHPRTREPRGPRPPLFDGIFLTHAHMGHYAGLLFLGQESYGAKGVATFVSPRMARYLRSNHPWRLLVETGVLELETIEPGRPVVLADDLTVTALAVPHRDELSDTLAFLIRGPRRTLLYLPDIDKWERFATPIEDVLAGVDVALLDGTFEADGEIPGRDMSQIPHPFLVESIERFAGLPAAERAKILFTHLNHTNPAAIPGGRAAGGVRRAGMQIARDGQVLGL